MPSRGRSPQAGQSIRLAGADLARHRVDEHRAGVLTPRLVLPRQRTISAISPRRLAVAARADERAATTTWSSVRSEPRNAGRGRASCRQPDTWTGRPVEVEHVDSTSRPPCRSHGHRRSSARAADRAGDPDRPLEAGQPGGRRARASTGRALRRRRRRPVRPAVTPISIPPARSAIDTAIPDAGVGDEQVRTATDDQHGQAAAVASATARDRRSSHAATKRRPAAHAIGRQRASGSSTAQPDRTGSRLATASLRVAVDGLRPHRHCVPQRAPRRGASRCRRSPSRCRRPRRRTSRARNATRSSRFGSHARAGRVGIELAFTMSLPVTPGMGSCRTDRCR